MLLGAESSQAAIPQELVAAWCPAASKGLAGQSSESGPVLIAKRAMTMMMCAKVKAVAATAVLSATVMSGAAVAEKTVMTSTRPPAIGLPAPSRYINFPSIDFKARVVEYKNGRLRMTFRGTWHNLAPQAVSYGIKTYVMPRRGKKNTVFRVVASEPAAVLNLARGESAPFSITVEAKGRVKKNYSEMIFVYLFSRDEKGLWKPYLMCASNGYLSVNPDVRVQPPYRGNKRFAPRGDPDPKHMIPTRKTLGYKDGTWECDVVEAFRRALASSPEPIFNNNRGGGDNLTKMAKGGMTSLHANGRFGKRVNTGAPLSRFLGALGGIDTKLHKRMMLLMTDEFPFYPVGEFPINGGFWLYIVSEGGTNRLSS